MDIVWLILAITGVIEWISRITPTSVIRGIQVTLGVLLASPLSPTFSPRGVWETLVLAGFAQIPLTVTNATIATSSLISYCFPDRSVSERKLSWNQEFMNTWAGRAIAR